VWHAIVGFLSGSPTDGWWTRFLYQRSLAIIYLVAFVAVVRQFRPLLGEHGLLPAPEFVRRVSFRQAPSLFHLRATDGAFAGAAWLGVGASLLALTGLSDAFGTTWSVAVWTTLFVLYLSFVNVGQRFYAFGWESILLEAGFFAIFLGPFGSASPRIVLWMLRWLLFRVMFGAGLIKLRGDPCWRRRTALYFHYETQPLPNPLSRWFHALPRPVHRLECWFTLFVELVVPFGYFAPSPVCQIAGALTILFQVVLILSGNLSWLNHLTIVIAIACFPIAGSPVVTAGLSDGRAIVLLTLTGAVLAMSWFPIRNMCSRFQMMNASFNPLHLVSTYGAFGSVDRDRLEVIVEGSDSLAGPWLPYEFSRKPGRTTRRLRFVSPYHLRLDWLMWFLPKSSPLQHPWFFALIAKLLANDRDTLRLLAATPFPDRPPRFLRARLYRYRFARRGSPAVWLRDPLGFYLPPLTLDDTGDLVLAPERPRHIGSHLPVEN
jgi:hypothetical protein